MSGDGAARLTRRTNATADACRAAYYAALRNVHAGAVTFTASAMAGMLLADCGGVVAHAIAMAVWLGDDSPWFESVVRELQLVEAEQC